MTTASDIAEALAEATTDEQVLAAFDKVRELTPEDFELVPYYLAGLADPDTVERWRRVLADREPPT